MKAPIPIGIGGAGVAVLIFALDRADVGVPSPVLVTLSIVAGLAILYAVMAWLMSTLSSGASTPHTSATSVGSSGHTVNAGGNVTIGALSQPAPSATQLTVEVQKLEPRRIPNWDNDWRVSIRVTNTSETAQVSAYLLAPVGGIAEDNYGDFNLQWETQGRNFTTLVKGKPERLHIARIQDTQRAVRFLSPGEYSGAPREHQHPPKKVTDSPIRGKLRFNSLTGGCEQRDIEIHLDHENTPAVHVGEPEPC